MRSNDLWTLSLINHVSQFGYLFGFIVGIVLWVREYSSDHDIANGYHDKHYHELSANLERWERCTSLNPKLRGDYVIMKIPEDNKMRSTLIRECGKAVINNENGYIFHQWLYLLSIFVN